METMKRERGPGEKGGHLEEKLIKNGQNSKKEKKER